MKRLSQTPPLSIARNHRPFSRRGEFISSTCTILFLSTLITLSTQSTSANAATTAPYPVGGFAMCQTRSSLHIQGGVAYGPDATYLTTTNQHFRLDLSKAFDSSSSSSSPPIWVNLTSDYSPFQRFHTGACTPDMATFLTIGNADVVNTGDSGSGFLMSYKVSDGTWNAVTQAVSGATNSNVPGDKGGKGKGKGGAGAGISAAGRTMVGFAFGGQPTNSSISGLGVAVGGGWLPLQAKTPSVQASDLTNLITEIDLLSIGADNSISSIGWSVAPFGGNSNANNANLGAIAGSRVVILPGTTGKAVILGGVTNGQFGGLPFINVRVVDMTTGSVVLQKTTGATLNSTPDPRYGHCAALSSDGNTIIMFGGSLAANNQITNDLFALDIRTWTWFRPTLKSSSVSPPPVRDHECAVVGDQFMSFFGFNANQAPASGSSSGSGSAIPPAPPIYVLSVSQWVWSTQFNPLPGTPTPPVPPIVPVNGSSNKINGAGIAFGVIFGLAFLGVIGYMLYAHKQKKKRKEQTLLLVEMENKRKQQEKLEKERKKKQEQGLPPTPPMAHAHEANYYGQAAQGYNSQGYDYSHGYDQSQGYNQYNHAPYGQQQQQPHDPFQDPIHNQRVYNGEEYLSHANNGHGSVPVGNPFDPRNPRYPNHNANEYVAEEMGHVSPVQANGLDRKPGDKSSYIDVGSNFRSR